MAFVKDMLRMWAHSWKRFISIAMITLLGVAVLTGIYAGCRDAFRSTDRFFDAQGLHDVQVLSTAGLSNGDIAALRKVNGVAIWTAASRRPCRKSARTALTSHTCRKGACRRKPAKSR